MTAALIPFPNPAPAVPGQGTELGVGLHASMAEACATLGGGAGFAQLVDAMIEGNSLFSSEFAGFQGNATNSADLPENSEVDTGDEEQPSQPARPDLALTAVFLLPNPVPVSIPRIELGDRTDPDLERNEAESALSGESTSLPVAMAAAAVNSDGPHSPVVGVELLPAISSQDWDQPVANDLAARIPLSVQARKTEIVVPSNTWETATDPTAALPPQSSPEAAQLSAGLPEFAGAPQPAGAAEQSGRGQLTAQSLAFALRLTGSNKSAEVETSALPRVQVAAGNLATEPAGVLTAEGQPEIARSAHTFTSSKSPVSGAVSQPAAVDVAAASVQVASRDNGPENADASKSSSKPVALTNTDSEAGSWKLKIRPTAETGTEQERSERTPTPVRSATTIVSTAAATVSDSSPVAGPGPRLTQTGSSDTPTVAGTGSLERTDAVRIDRTPSRSARDILVQVTVEDSRKVEVQVGEKAGEVRVAVRTADPELNQSLRAELGSLVSRLETAGYRADSFAPSERFVSSPSTARQEPSSSQQDAPRGFSGQGQGSSGQGGNGQRRQESQAAHWAEQFANSLSPESETGKESQSWQSLFSR